MASAAIRNTPADHRRGLLITGIGGLIMTFDTPLLRLVGTDAWTATFWRGLFVFVAMWAFWTFMRWGRSRPIPFINGRDALVVACLHCAANLFFMLALFNTTVANLVFIMALNPLIAALCSLVWLKERIGTATWIAIFAGIAGVGVIVMDGIAQGSVFGDLLALGCTLVLGFGLTFVRRSGKDLSLSPALGALMSAAIALPLADQLWLSGSQWIYMMANGLIVMPIASAMLVTGPRYITAPEVAMFFLLETVLAPVWVWLVVGEVPTLNSLIGGAIILTALALHTLYRLARTKGG